EYADGGRQPKGQIDATFQELLFEDAARSASRVPPESYIDRRRLNRYVAAGAGSLALLIGLTIFGPTMYRFGIPYLWAGWMATASEPLYKITVLPGNTKLARHTDQAITGVHSAF